MLKTYQTPDWHYGVSAARHVHLWHCIVWLCSREGKAPLPSACSTKGALSLRYWCGPRGWLHSASNDPVPAGAEAAPTASPSRHAGRVGSTGLGRCVRAGMATWDLRCEGERWLGSATVWHASEGVGETCLVWWVYLRDMLSLWLTICFQRFDMETTTVVWGSCSCSALISEFGQSPDKLPGFIKHQPHCTEPSWMPACSQDFVYKIPRGDLQDSLQPWARTLLPRGDPTEEVKDCKQQCHVTVQDSNQHHFGGISKESKGRVGLYPRGDGNTPLSWNYCSGVFQGGGRRCSVSPADAASQGT